MDPEQFLIKQGWKKGEGLRSGSIKKPVLVKHRKNNKGLGYNPLASEGWWEKVFDGHLKSLDAVNGSNGEVKFLIDEEKRRKSTSELYSFFRLGEMLSGTIDEPKGQKRKRSDSDNENNSKPEKSKSKKRSRKEAENEQSKSKSKSESKSKLKLESKSKSRSKSKEKSKSKTKSESKSKSKSKKKKAD